MGFLGNMNIGKRLAVGFSLILAMAVLITVAGDWRLNQMAHDTEQMMAEPLAKERMISEWSGLIFSAVRRTAATVKSSDPSLGDYFKEDMVVTNKRSAELVKQIEPLIAEGEEKALFDKLSAQRKLYLAARDSAVKAKTEGNNELANKILDESFTPVSKTYQDLVKQLVTMQHERIDGISHEVVASASTSVRMITAIAACAVVLGAICSWLLTRGITRPIREAVKVAEAVASGDLTHRIDSQARDETGALLRALRHMNDSLVAIVTQVRGGTDTIATASGEITAGNLDLSARTEQQAGSLEESAASMEELTGTVRQNADNARQANQLSITASEVAAQGGAVVSQVITTMGSINASSRKIVDIIAVIDGIAFQTNILALNAAVEAARAGEQGRGFAVVASEVRTLAQRSAAAAKEIKTLIGDSVDKVDTGTRLVDQAGATMEQVVESIRRVTDIMAEITSASLEQSAGIEQVNQAIGEMDAATQQNAALVEESAAAATSLQDQASRLAQVVRVFKVEGDTPATAAPGAAASRPARVAAARPARVAGRAIAAPQPKRAAQAASAGGDWEEF
jgi:methyl-accepting chemotaxis protein